MAGLIQRIVSSFVSSSKRNRSRGIEKRQERFRRSLRLESLEGRSLMAIDLAVISGVSFVDANGNNSYDNGVDAIVGNATIQLFRDDGDGIFNDAVDTLVATITSNAVTGEYSFASVAAGGLLPANTLTEGVYFVRQQAVAGLTPPAPASVTITSGDRAGVSVQNIDPFDTTAQLVTVDGVTPNASLSLAAPEVLGGRRDISATFVGGAQSFSVEVLPGLNVLAINSGLDVQGTAIIQYDGDSDPDTLSHTGLGGVSLNGNVATAGLHIQTRGDQAGATADIFIYTNATDFSSTTINIPSSVTLVDIFVPFSSFTNFGAGADFNSIGAIEVLVNGVVELQATVAVVQSVQPTVLTANLENDPLMSIGNLVFLDTNSDGVFNGSDSGIANVRVELYNDVNGNGTFEPGTDTFIEFTTTSLAGAYLFDDLVPGDYLVVIPATEFGVGQPLENHRVAIQNGPANTNNANQGVVAAGGVVVASTTLVLNSAPIDDGDTDPNTNLALDFGFTNAELVLTKVDTPDPVNVGQELTYTLTATNNGPSTTTNTVISDALPTGLTLLSATYIVNGGAVQDASNVAGTVSTSGFNLDAGQSAVLTIIATVGGTFVSGTVNTGAVDSDQTDVVTAQATTTVIPDIDLEIVKTIVGGATTVGLGETLTYRLSLTNDSDVTVTGIEVFDDLPPGFTAGTLPAGVALGVAPNDLVWTIASIAPGQTLDVDIPVTVTAAATVAPGQRNTATINVVGLTGFRDIDSSNDVSFIDVTVQPRYDLLITKDNGVASVTTGQTITYTITVNNDGPSDATNVQISDTLPNQLQFVSATRNGNDIGSANGQAYTATIPTLASGETATILLVATVRANATGNIVNTVTVTANNPEFETPGRPNSATDTDTLNRVVTLNIDKTDSTDPVVAGGANFQYIVTAFNSGSADAPNVLFSDPLPTGITFVSGTFEINEATPRNGAVTFNQTTNRLEANLGTLLANGNSTTNRALITLVVRAEAGAAAGQVTNTATLSSPDNTTGVTDSETTQVNRDFDLTVTKSDGVDTVARGQVVNYTIVVTNSGPSTATNVTVTDTLPTGMTFQSASPGFTNNSGVVSGSIASLGSGQSATVTISATVNNDAPNGATLTNTVTVAAAGETNTTNNTATASASVLTTADLSGFVYLDANQNGIRDGGDLGIANVMVQISGTSLAGDPVNRTTTTDNSGAYSFNDLPIGTYTVIQTQPDLFMSFATNVGTIGGVPTGTGSVNQIASINLTGDSIGNNFGEVIQLSKRWFLASSPPVPQ
ncbi:isopeptide-forming domain-containing fimbrial protein [Pirellulaceae bacterium SH449]